MKLKTLTSSFYNHSHLLIILALPVLLLAIHHQIFFTCTTGVDAWVYFGYFVNWEQLFQFFPRTYYGDRLSWILPGYFIHSWFSPVVADYVLHLGFYYAAVFSFYLTVKYLIGRTEALIMTLWMGSHYYFLQAISWDYVDGAGITYCLLATLTLTLAAKFPYWQVSLFLSGIFCSALIHSNLFWMTLVPLLVIYYLYANLLFRNNSIWISFILFISGIFALTSLLGIINYHISTPKDFLFFLPELNFSLKGAKDGTGFAKPFASWFNLQAYWLFLPIFTLLISFSVILLNRRIHQHKSQPLFSFFLQPYFIVHFLILLFWQLKGKPTLQLHYYTLS